MSRPSHNRHGPSPSCCGNFRRTRTASLEPGRMIRSPFAAARAEVTDPGTGSIVIAMSCAATVVHDHETRSSSTMSQRAGIETQAGQNDGIARGHGLVAGHCRATATPPPPAPLASMVPGTQTATSPNTPSSPSPPSNASPRMNAGMPAASSACRTRWASMTCAASYTTRMGIPLLPSPAGISHAPVLAVNRHPALPGGRLWHGRLHFLFVFRRPAQCPQRLLPLLPSGIHFVRRGRSPRRTTSSARSSATTSRPAATRVPRPASRPSPTATCTSATPRRSA